jgi:hypothetical protein
VPINYRGALLSTLLHVSLIPTSYNRPSTYQLQRSATEGLVPISYRGALLHSHRHENLKSYTAVFMFTENTALRVYMQLHPHSVSLTGLIIVTENSLNCFHHLVSTAAGRPDITIHVKKWETRQNWTINLGAHAVSDVHSLDSAHFPVVSALPRSDTQYSRFPLSLLHIPYAGWVELIPAPVCVINSSIFRPIAFLLHTRCLN